jgi:hypothetical protein
MNNAEQVLLNFFDESMNASKISWLPRVQQHIRQNRAAWSRLSISIKHWFNLFI